MATVGSFFYDGKITFGLWHRLGGVLGTLCAVSDPLLLSPPVCLIPVLKFVEFKVIVTSQRMPDLSFICDTSSVVAIGSSGTVSGSYC